MYFFAESALQTGEIASHINEHMKQHENFQKMLSIQKSFDRSAPKILAPGREFIREGVLKKVLVLLLEDSVLYYKQTSIKMS